MNLEKVSFSLELFEKFTEGFLTGTAGLLTPEEIDVLPLGARTLTLELAARFLMDYLDGDIYFKVTRPEHNLIRRPDADQAGAGYGGEIQPDAGGCQPLPRT